MNSRAEKLKILVVMAHPHDFTHVSGTCGIHAASGDPVTVVIMMNGAAKYNESYYDELLKPENERDPEIINKTAEYYILKREDEIRKACGIFGIEDVRILRMPEPFRLSKNPEAIDKLSDIILEVRPDLVITQSPYLDGNLKGRHGMANGILNDHTETAFAVWEALAMAAKPNYETKQAPHIVAMVYYPGIYFMRDEIDFYVDISEWIEKRVEAEALFESQGSDYDLAKRQIEIISGYKGFEAGTQYAEGFVKDKIELFSRIEISDIELKKSREFKMKHKQRISGKLKGWN